MDSKKLYIKILTLLFTLLLYNSTLAKKYPKPILTIDSEIYGSKITSISSDREGIYLLTTSLDNKLRLWDGQSGKMLKVFQLPPKDNSKLYKAQISPNGKITAVLTSVGIYVFDTISGEAIKKIDLISELSINIYYYWFEIYYSENSEFLAIYSFYDNTTGIYDTKKYELIKTLNGKSFFSPKGEILVFDGKNALIYDSNLKLKRRLRHKNSPDFVTFSPDGQMIAIGELSAINRKKLRIKIDIYTSELRKIKSIIHKTDHAIYRIFWHSGENALYATCGEFYSSNMNINKLLKIDISKKQVLDILDLSDFEKIEDLIYLGKNKFAAVTSTPSIIIFYDSE